MKTIQLIPSHWETTLVDIEMYMDRKAKSLGQRYIGIVLVGIMTEEGPQAFAISCRHRVTDDYTDRLTLAGFGPDTINTDI